MKPHHALACVPVLFAVAGVLWGNRVQPFILGLPFFMAWTIAGVLLTAVVMALVYRLDPANRQEEDGQEQEHRR